MGWAQDRPDLQHTVRICSKFVANPTARDWMRVKRIGRYAEGCPNIGNSGWAGDQVTRKRVSQRNTSLGEIISCKVFERINKYCCVELWRNRNVGNMHGSHENAQHGNRARNCVRCAGAACRRECGHWNHRKTGTRKSEASGLELSVDSGRCAGEQFALRNIPTGNHMADIVTNSARRRLDHETYGMSGMCSIRPTGFWGFLGRAEV